MAYVPSNQDDEEAKRRQAAGTPPGSFGDTTPGSTPTHTNFVNVSDYISKNPDASAHLGDLGAAKLDQQKGEAQSAVNDTQSKFGQDVQAGGQKLDQGFLDSAFASPETFVKDPGNTAKFMSLRDAAYNGPDSLQSTSYYAPTESKISGLKTTAEGLGTEAGRNSLIGDLSSHPTTGKTSLNQLLLQGSPDAAAKIENSAKGFGGVEDAWQNFVNTSPTQVTQAKTDTDAARTATRAGLDTATQNFSQGLNSSVAKATNDRNAFNLNEKNIEDAIAGGGSGLTAQQLKDLGIGDAYPYISKLNDFNGATGLGYYNSSVPLSSYETNQGVPNSNVPTAASVATPEQYAREAALQQMSGMDQGLPDQQGAAYNPNGKLPTLDAKGAFDAAGARLKGLDAAWQPKVAGYGPDDLAMLYAIQGRNPTGGNGSYYTDPTAGAAPSGGFGIAPPPPGWNASQPIPYPRPTSNPPSNLANPQWNPYTGTWEGQNIGNPGGGSGGTGGGGVHTF